MIAALNKKVKIIHVCTAYNSYTSSEIKLLVESISVLWYTGAQQRSLIGRSTQYNCTGGGLYF